jgi:hypothetical protein
MTLEEQLEVAEASSSSEGKMLAGFLRDLISEGDGHALVSCALDEIIEWAKAFQKSLE